MLVTLMDDTRQSHLKRRSMSGFTFHAYAAAVLFYNGFGNKKAQSGTRRFTECGAVQLSKFFKNDLLRSGGYPWAIVAYPKEGLMSSTSEADDYGSGFWVAEFERIGQ